MAKILIVEDDSSLAETISTWLSTENHLVDVACDGLDAKARLTSFEYDLFVLDWDVPEITGIQICSLIRSRGLSTPILMLTGKSAIAEKTAGFGAGADDYLTKPFHPEEMMARISALLRRPASYISAKLTLGNLELDMKKREVLQSGVPIALQPMEYTVLEFFMKHPNEMFSSETLLRRLWDSDAEVSSEALYVCLARLRRKLEKNGVCPIATVRGAGYILKK